MENRILVFGKGLLGSAFEKYLPDNIVRKVVSHNECDIMNFEDVKKIVSEFSPEVIINSAAITDVDYCENHSQEAFIINSGGAGYIASIARDRGIKIVHVSTDYVFNGTKSNQYVEEDITNPLNTYAKSKQEGEELVRFSGADFIIARVQWLFGEFRDTFLDKAIIRMINGETVNAISDQYGSPTYVKYVVYAIAKLLSGQNRGIFHIASEGVCSRVEQLNYICDLLNLNKNLIVERKWSEVQGAAPRPFRIELSKELLFKVTGYRLPDWKSQIREYVLFKYGSNR